MALPTALDLRLTDRRSACCRVSWPIVTEGRDERADHHKREAASNSSRQQKLATTDAVEEEDGREREDRVDDACERKGSDKAPR